MSLRLIREVLEDVELSRSQLLVLQALCNYADDDGGTCYPSVPRIAWVARMGERQTIRALAQLKTMGVIEVVQRPSQHHTTHYQIHLDKAPRRAPMVFNDGVVSPSPGVTFDAPGVTFSASRGDIRDARGDIRDIRGDMVTPLDSPGVTFSASRGDMVTPKPVNKPTIEINNVRPVPSSPKGPTPPPESMALSEADYDFAVSLGIPRNRVDFHTDEFLDYWRGEGAKKSDWKATWRNAMRRTSTFLANKPKRVEANNAKSTKIFVG